MPPSYHLYGQALRDYHEGRPRRMIFERDDGLSQTADMSGLFAPYRKWRPRVEQVAIRSARGRVLDVGCGPGRVTLHLQRRGLRVTAIDISPDAVEVARERGVLDARVADGCRLSFPNGSFDTLVMFGNNFGICGGWDDTRSFLLRARRVVRKGGQIIASTRVPGSWIERHAEYIRRNVRAGRPPGLLRLRIRYRGRTGSWFPLLILSPDDLLRMCEPLGWHVKRVLLEDGDPTSYAFVAEKGRKR